LRRFAKSKGGQSTQREAIDDAGQLMTPHDPHLSAGKILGRFSGADLITPFCLGPNADDAIAG